MLPNVSDHFTEQRHETVLRVEKVELLKKHVMQVIAFEFHSAAPMRPAAIVRIFPALPSGRKASGHPGTAGRASHEDSNRKVVVLSRSGLPNSRTVATEPRLNTLE